MSALNIPKGVTLDNTLGAVLVGFAVACCVYGILITQVFTYFSNYPGDRPIYKLLVLFLLVLETADQCLIGHILYFYGVTNFANVRALLAARVTWSFILQQTLGAIVGTTVKFMFGLRVWRFSEHNFFITGLILSTTLGGLGTALAFTVKAFKLPSVFSVIQLRTLGSISLGVGVITDIVIAVSLCYFLNKLRTGYRQSDTLVNSLVRYAINTGALTSAISLSTLILYNVMPTNMIFIATFFVLSKLYAISFMATLNTRRIVRGKGTDRQGTTATNGINANNNNNTNMFHLGTRLPSLGPREMDGWEVAYTLSSGSKDVYMMESVKTNSDSFGSAPSSSRYGHASVLPYFSADIGGTQTHLRSGPWYGGEFRLGLANGRALFLFLANEKVTF
ncbi:hypothetical protein K435DRAFT_841531 [Dendrothele bispora CBS 962.96]|uniref:DUF6534 domain-containing protein n=1 Tax=Dendrothele bispora (strain CBS 962.96) TaxID=1314807 RepID=A0A4S8LM78_DENBC|nr:hypothetical protein K435DRAFT_841531 [Dendrothele bispora CBS 962.96]